MSSYYYELDIDDEIQKENDYREWCRQVDLACGSSSFVSPYDFYDRTDLSISDIERIVSERESEELLDDILLS